MTNNTLNLVKTWPFREAIRIMEKISSKTIDNGQLVRDISGYDIVLETGYGPSGLPHMGTLGEVARTKMVYDALKFLFPNINVRLISFSDDMDGLRKVPDNVPNKDLLEKNLNKPLTQVPDPFGLYDSFGRHNNNRLIEFLNSFNIQVEFMSSTDCYKSGMFDQALLKVLDSHKEILDIMLPTLGEERQSTYSPFLPISPTTGRVLQVKVENYNISKGTVEFFDEDGKLVEIKVTGGNCKLQWKVDWGMRWYALGITYEMYGKDLIDSQVLSAKICRVLGKEPPIDYLCEHFLDEEGKKISKSKGNGLSVEDWLRYAPRYSLIYYMFKSPQRAKQLYFGVIPAVVDEYLGFLEDFVNDSSEFGQFSEKVLNNPVWNVHSGNPLMYSANKLNFSLLLNLVNVCGGENKDILLGYAQKYLDHGQVDSGLLDEMINGAINYYNDFVLPNKKYREPTDLEKNALADFADILLSLLNVNIDGGEIQKIAYDIGKKYMSDDLKSWFSAIYQVVLGQESGPRIGNFIKLYGVQNFANLVQEKIS
jgi:lysyl-tRNA synthetase, class I